MKKLFGKHDLFKIVGLGILICVLLTWVIKPSTFNGTEMTVSEITRAGFNDVNAYGLLSVYYFSIIVTFLLILGGLYEVLGKTNGYKKLIAKLTKFFSGKEIVLVLISTFLFAVMTTVANEVYQVILFAPLVITVLLNLKTDKITAFCATFGGILVGLLGAVFCPIVLSQINSYLELGYDTGMFLRLVLFASTYVLFSFFTLMHMTKVKKGKLIKEKEEDIFEVAEVEDKEKSSSTKVWPLVVILLVLFLYQVLGYIDWVNVFKVEFFTNWNTMITGMTLGTVITKLIIVMIGFGFAELFNYLIHIDKFKKTGFKLNVWPCILIGIAGLIVVDVLSVASSSLDLYSVGIVDIVNTFFNKLTIKDYAFGATPIVNYLLGSTKAFGSWDLFVIQGIMLLATLVISWVYKVKFDAVLSSFADGAKKMLKPILIVMMIYVVCILTVMYPVMPTIYSWFMNLTTKFNVFTASIATFIASIFNVDMRYVAGSLLTYLTTVYSTTDKSLIRIIFQSMYGLAQFVAPTSLALMLGLSYLNISYKSWLKYIWLFFIGLIIITLGIVCFVRYI